MVPNPDQLANIEEEAERLWNKLFGIRHGKASNTPSVVVEIKKKEIDQ